MGKTTPPSRPPEVTVCFCCGVKGHYRAQCPSRPQTPANSTVLARGGTMPTLDVWLVSKAIQRLQLEMTRLVSQVSALQIAVSRSLQKRASDKTNRDFLVSFPCPEVRSVVFLSPAQIQSNMQRSQDGAADRDEAQREWTQRRDDTTRACTDTHTTRLTQNIGSIQRQG